MNARTTQNGAKNTNTKRGLAVALVAAAVLATVTLVAVLPDALAHHGPVPHRICDPRVDRPVQLELTTGATNGVAHAIGALDDSWYVASTPGLGGPGAYSITPVAPWATMGGANWINPYGSQAYGLVYTPGNNAINPPLGTYVYGLRFELTCLPENCDDAVFDFDYASDNGVVFQVNGGPAIETNPSLYAWASITNVHSAGCGSLVVGLNTLTATVVNPHLWTGLLVQGFFTLTP